MPTSSVDLIVLAMPSHLGNLHTAELLFNSDYRGKVTAIVRYPDEEEALLEMGVHSVYNIYQAAGTGLADQGYGHPPQLPQQQTLSLTIRAALPPFSIPLGVTPPRRYVIQISTLSFLQIVRCQYPSILLGFSQSIDAFKKHL